MKSIEELEAQLQEKLKAIEESYTQSLSIITDSLEQAQKKFEKAKNYYEQQRLSSIEKAKRLFEEAKTPKVRKPRRTKEEIEMQEAKKRMSEIAKGGSVPSVPVQEQVRASVFDAFASLGESESTHPPEEEEDDIWDMTGMTPETIPRYLKSQQAQGLTVPQHLLHYLEKNTATPTQIPKAPEPIKPVPIVQPVVAVQPISRSPEVPPPKPKKGIKLLSNRKPVKEVGPGVVLYQQPLDD